LRVSLLEDLLKVGDLRLRDLCGEAEDVALADERRPLLGLAVVAEKHRRADRERRHDRAPHDLPLVDPPAVGVDREEAGAERRERRGEAVVPSRAVREVASGDRLLGSREVPRLCRQHRGANLLREALGADEDRLHGAREVARGEAGHDLREQLHGDGVGHGLALGLEGGDARLVELVLPERSPRLEVVHAPRERDGELLGDAVGEGDLRVLRPFVALLREALGLVSVRVHAPGVEPVVGVPRLREGGVEGDAALAPLERHVLVRRLDGREPNVLSEQVERLLAHRNVSFCRLHRLFLLGLKSNALFSPTRLGLPLQVREWSTRHRLA
jgi:hypothetical protein